MKLNEMTEQQLQEFYSEVLAEYQNCLAQGLNLNMSRGKPGLEQLALSDDLLNMYIDPADTRPTELKLVITASLWVCPHAADFSPNCSVCVSNRSLPAEMQASH